MNRTVNVYHNTNPDWGDKSLSGYRDGDKLKLVFSYLGGLDDEIDECERAFRIGNGEAFRDDSERAYSHAYYAAARRSLSVGDVVEYDGSMWACDSFGWTAIDIANVVHCS